ncbi:Oxygen-dependent choline dehydrogenase [Pseudovibrio axinellae]|uniref:Choline dehydrogenase n=1 Tax=Pseudovibrio axinellae TaxID=989403 RepID=A0A165Z5E7_9HYPH|nr:choline dehydrogenase [Pseudovibrio axinellae]KZL19525.1 Oxygen-dependent choline dehydrogenase [Pseudovibrio axinellae]SEQ30445.1 choline dehydrogenase [Pseudovibrio axinellae]
MTADFIIIGAGSAGCALANRLSEDPQNKVVLLEFGGSDIGPFIQMPAALSYPMNMSRYDWGYESAPEPHLGGRKLALPRGKVVGGSSSINGMVYVRGNACDFDTWEEMGAKGWGYQDVLPYFQRLENTKGEAGWRGKSGPLYVSRGTRWNPLYDAFVQAGEEAGYARTEDYNGYRQEGFGDMEMTVHKGRRWSASNAYLWPIKGRKNLETISGARVLRVLMEDKRAVGVEYMRGGQVHQLKCTREVIVSASSINSPKLLMHSGIGDASALSALGIDVVADRKGVGANLQDHLELYIQQACTQPITLFKHWNLISKGLIGAQWLFGKAGLGTTNHFETCGFIRSKAGVQYPDIQFHFLPFAVRYDGQAAAEGHGYQVHVGPMRSKSRGSVTLQSADPMDKPNVLFNYMSHEDDWEDFRQCIRLTRELFGQKAFDQYRGKEIQPGSDVQTNDQLDAFIKEHAESAFHPCGTCKMGDASDASAVVDSECRVIGVDGLRVADSSIFPQITNGNLNAPSIMVGEKAADHILGKGMLPASDQQAWVHPNWQTEQR